MSPRQRMSVAYESETENVGNQADRKTCKKSRLCTNYRGRDNKHEKGGGKQ